MKKSALFCSERKHRYYLLREWDSNKPKAMFIGLNPSTANEDKDDPTIKRVIEIAKHNGFGAIYMLNCFTHVSTNPKELNINSPMEQFNNYHLKWISEECKEVVFAWGNFSIVQETGRDKELIKMFPNAKALHINKNGSPKHPLYCKKDSKFIGYK